MTTTQNLITGNASDLSRDEIIVAIRKNLRARTGRGWSVKGGRGTSWSWITITAPPARQDRYGCMTDDDAQALADALGLDAAHRQGVSVPGQNDYRQEYLDRSAGQVPSRTGVPNWD
jgi:hypothetical protein